MKFVSITKKVIADLEMVTTLTFEKSDQASLDFIVNGLKGKCYETLIDGQGELLLESSDESRLFSVNHKTGMIKFWVFRELV